MGASRSTAYTSGSASTRTPSALIQECYRELTHYDRAWEEAFARQDFVVFEEHVAGRWVRFPLFFPRNDEIPGQRTQLELEPWDYITMILEGLRDLLLHPPNARALSRAGHATTWLEQPTWWRRIPLNLREHGVTQLLDPVAWIELALLAIGSLNRN